jgi:hypothetical protein
MLISRSANYKSEPPIPANSGRDRDRTRETACRAPPGVRILAGVLVIPVAFVLTLGLGVGASRLRSVAGLAALAAVAFAASSGDPRSALLRAVVPAAVALLAADAFRVRRSAEWRAARVGRRPVPRPARRTADRRAA